MSQPPAPSRRGLLAVTGLAPFTGAGATQPGHRVLRSFDFSPYRLEGADEGDADRPEFCDSIDAELIALCDLMAESRAESIRLYCGKDSPSDPDSHPVIGPRLAELDAIEDTVVPRLCGMRARSLACAEAMARVALLFAARDQDGNLMEKGRDWPAMAALEWLAGDGFSTWAAADPADRADDPPPPVRRAAA